MKQTQRSYLNDLALQAANLAHGRRPEPGEGSASLAAHARVAYAIWSQVVADYDRRAPWLEDRDQLVEVLGLAYQAARKAGFHTATPENLADWLIEEIRQNTGTAGVVGEEQWAEPHD